jgi:PEGA domain-containing protein
MSPFLKTILCSMLLLPSGLFLQTAPAPGYIHVTSKQPGAIITINDKPTGAKTNSTLVVSPGSYTVGAIGGSGPVSCDPSSVTVKSGQTQEVKCN